MLNCKLSKRPHAEARQHEHESLNKQSNILPQLTDPMTTNVTNLLPSNYDIALPNPTLKPNLVTSAAPRASFFQWQ